jgi:hypothetical protein
MTSGTPPLAGTTSSLAGLAPDTRATIELTTDN